jgi:hypothetical membrane protein
MALSSAAKAGTLLFLGSVQFGIFMIVAEAVSPTYSVQLNYVSDLGSAFPASAPIFNSSIVLFGLLVMVGVYFLHKAFARSSLTLPMMLVGVGLVGVGLFNEGSPFGLHPLFSLVTFVFSGASAVSASRLLKAPMSYVSVALGSMTLAALVLYAPGTGSIGTAAGIGVGGLERMIVYPALFWAIGFSAQLMGMDDTRID